MDFIIIGKGRIGSIIEEILLLRSHNVIAMYGSEDVYQLESNKHRCDAVIDFSRPGALESIASYVRATGTPLISGTTGLSNEHIETIKALGNYSPVVYSANYSLGIAIFKRILNQISETMMDNSFDVEIVETHHNQKVDAPSGTANALYEAICPSSASPKLYGRSGLCGKRAANEIGIHSVRGGSVAGEHTVMFLGEDEKFEIKHTAISPRIFAAGAVGVAEKIGFQSNGFYTFEDIMLQG